jgi:RNA polymerase sigma-70 factor, ECF subfamily
MVSDSSTVAWQNDDGVWVSRIREGDQDAARALVDRLHPVIIRSVRRRLPSRTSEEDLVQIVFMKVFKNLDQFSGGVPLEHWVSRITVNTCLNQARHEALRPELRFADLSEEDEAVVQYWSLGQASSAPRNNAACELLDLLLTSLKPDERLVITLLHLEERRSEDISAMTGWSVSLVKVKAFRGRRKMRKLWKTLVRQEKA